MTKKMHHANGGKTGLAILMTSGCRPLIILNIPGQSYAKTPEKGTIGFFCGSTWVNPPFLV
jgi:hypothetical protein